MEDKLQIFKNPVYDESIIKEEWHTYPTETKSYENNDECEININQQDAFLDMSDAALIIEGKVNIVIEEGLTQAQTTEVTAARVKITNNAAAFLFDFISYELNGIEIDKVRDPGITSTLRAYLTYNINESKAFEVAGWDYPEKQEKIINADKQFLFRIPLNFLFGLFQDYRKVISGKHKIRLVRSHTDNNCFKTSSKFKKLKFSINNIELRVKHIYPSDAVRLRLLEGIGQNKPIQIPFRRWEIHHLPTLRVTDKDVWAVKTTTSVERPRYVIVVFQTAIRDNIEKDATNFDHVNMMDLRLYLNSECYPYESLKLDFSKKRYTELYYMYLNFQKSFLNKLQPEPLITYEQFKHFPIFVIDTTRQNEIIKSSTVDVKLEFQGKDSFPENTRAYCIIVHDCVVEYLPLTNIVRNLI